MPLRKLLYILQSENYDISRFLKWALKHPLSWLKKETLEKRGKLIWTLKIRLLTLLAFAIFIAIPFLLYVFAGIFVLGLLIYFIAALLLLPILLIIALLLAKPFDWTAKFIIIFRAKNKLKKNPKLKIIGITGSYGKTTMKEVVSALLGAKFNILKTSENINTELGVAQFILKELTGKHEIFVCEMGAFQKGDIKKLCELSPPDISILTGINEAHLERFGSIENTVQAKFEIVKYMRGDGLALLNGKNELVKNNAPRFIENKKAILYGTQNDYEIRNAARLEDGGFSFEVYLKEQKIIETKTKFLGSYIFDALLCGIMVAKHFGIENEKISQTIPNIKPIPHRLYPMHTPYGVIVIDDAYNGNPDGALAAMETLKTFKDKRKIYITPGLVEIGKASAEIHEKLGKHLSGCADLVLLIRNNITPYLEKGLLSARFPKENIVFFDTTEDAHAALATILRPNDVILFQNDWSDNYL